MNTREYFYVYILSSFHNRVLYTGITSDLIGRVYQHKNKLADGFTKKYNVDRLVWYEQHGDVNEAIKREKLIKRWKRGWKIEMIEKMNAEWRDLYQEICS